MGSEGQREPDFITEQCRCPVPTSAAPRGWRVTMTAHRAVPVLPAQASQRLRGRGAGVTGVVADHHGLASPHRPSHQPPIERPREQSERGTPEPQILCQGVGGGVLAAGGGRPLWPGDATASKSLENNSPKPFLQVLGEALGTVCLSEGEQIDHCVFLTFFQTSFFLCFR